jgi:hypothetical protein
MSFLNIKNGIRLLARASAPASPQEGLIYFDINEGLKVYRGGSFSEVPDLESLTAAEITFDPSSLNNIDSESTNIAAALADLDSILSGKVDSTQLGEPEGVATLDANGKVPLTQLPNSIMEYKGTWNADTNTPTLTNGSGNNDPERIGDVYRVTTAGSTDFGDGAIEFELGDYAILNDSFIWEKAHTAEVVAGVSSVNSQVGDVELNAADIPYDNQTSGLVAEDVQAALDELRTVISDGVEEAIAAGRYKESVRLVATSNLSLTGHTTIDSINTVDGDRILALSQTDPAENGVYVASSGAWSRAEDFDTAEEFIPGLMISVLEGNEQGALYLVDDEVETLDTDPVSFMQAASGVAADLSNLDETNINQPLRPSSSGSLDLGASARRWRTLWLTQTVNFGTNMSVNENVTMVDADSTQWSGIRANNTKDIGISTYNIGGSDNTKRIALQTGNVADGQSGEIWLRTGVPSGTGIRGNIRVEAGNITLLEDNSMQIKNMADPSDDQDAATKKYVDDEISAAEVSVDDQTIESVEGTLQVKADGIDDTHIRLRNDQHLRARNAANDADIEMLKVTDSDNLLLGSDLEMNDKALLGPVQRGAATTGLVEEEYIHELNLIANETDVVIPELTFDSTVFAGLEITYKIQEENTGSVGIGTIRIATDGTVAALVDMNVETATIPISFDAQMDNDNVQVIYTSGANGATLRLDIKRIRT